MKSRTVIVAKKPGLRVVNGGVGRATATYLAISVAVSAQTLPDSIAPKDRLDRRAIRGTGLERDAHAAVQVEKMLADRPAMANYRDVFGEEHQLNGADVIISWAKRRFAGDYVSGPVDWNSQEPQVSVADHLNPTDKTAAFIRIAEKTKVKTPFSFEQLWFHCAYELISLSYWPNWAELNQRALSGQIDREGYVDEAARLEFAALVDTSKFYATIWTAWAREHHFPSDSTIWRTTTAVRSFAWWRRGFHDRQGHPWTPFGTYYDHIAAARLRQP